VTTVNVFNSLKRPIKKKTSFPAIYDRTAGWVEINLKEKGDDE